MMRLQNNIVGFDNWFIDKPKLNDSKYKNIKNEQLAIFYFRLFKNDNTFQRDTRFVNEQKNAFFTKDTIAKYVNSAVGKQIDIEHNNSDVIGTIESVFLNSEGFERTESKKWVEADNFWWASAKIREDVASRFKGTSTELRIKQETKDSKGENNVLANVVHEFEIVAVTVTNNPNYTDCDVLLRNSSVDDNLALKIENATENNQKSLTFDNRVLTKECLNEENMSEQPKDNKIENSELEQLKNSIAEIKNSLEEKIQNAIKNSAEEIKNSMTTEIKNSFSKNLHNSFQEDEIKNSLRNFMKNEMSPKPVSVNMSNNENEKSEDKDDKNMTNSALQKSLDEVKEILKTLTQNNNTQANIKNSQAPAFGAYKIPDPVKENTKQGSENDGKNIFASFFKYN